MPKTTLRTKTVILFATSILGVIISCLLITRYFFLVNIHKVEEMQIERLSSQAQAVIESIVASQEEHSYDWAYWDESYLLLKQGDSQFEERNLYEGTLDTLGLDMMIYLTTDYQVVASTFRNMPQQHFQTELDSILAASGIQEHIQQMSEVLDDEKGSISGLVKTGEQIWVISLTPIRNSEGTSEVAGWLLWGQHLSYRFPADYQKILSAQNEIVANKPEQKVASIGSGSALLWLEEERESITTYSPLNDMTGERIGYLQTSESRLFTHNSEQLFLYLIAIMTLAAGLIAALTLLVFRAKIGKRFLHLEEGIANIINDRELPIGKASDEFERVANLIEILADSSSAAEEKLTETLQKFDVLYRSSNVGVVLVVDRIIVDSNHALENMLGYQKKELISHPLTKLCAEEQHCGVDDLYRAIEQGKLEQDAQMRTKSGELIPVSIEVAPLNMQGQHAIMMMVKDLSEQKHQEALIAQLTERDPISGLLNRPAIVSKFSEAMSGAIASPVLMYICVGRLRDIVEIHGIEVYDQVISLFSSKLQSMLSDCVLGRISDHEFIAFSNAPNAVDVLTSAGDHLCRQSDVTMLVAGLELEINVHMVLFDDLTELGSITDISQVARHAVQFKSVEDRCIIDVDHVLIKEAKDALVLNRDIAAAIREKKLFPFYQPIVDCQSGEVMGFEALARWQHEELGFVSPAVFIPIAEQQNLIVELGEQILQQSCRFIAAINQTRLASGKSPYSLHVNLSAPHFYHTTLVGFLEDTLKSSGLGEGNLVVEITESMLVGAEEEVIERMKTIRELGVALALDDFGTGFASLGTLCSYPLDIVKLDRSYIMQLEHNEKAKVLVRNVAAMAKELGLGIVAEGVETASQHRKLKVWKIDEIQGYLFYKPMSGEEIQQRFC